ncbi:ribosomal protein S18 acetylase RimI-like enzyme [Peribacillus deserti]|uniref:Ribosomal protein S18 acetylase RimI-like enzyme n=1 Tax=Peribacillus deserti TaxID=673318 RepID=A0ABS2QP72_9BACI|nr:GNAT family N-acetyltransferase [Peribacillus deserti]MBM7694735.1 ribosomal protein S18 acetylase RimI-like enzyme [Peribacillus deserti]
MDAKGEVFVKEIDRHERPRYKEYLLLADEDESIVNEYLFEGEMFAIYFNESLAGTVLFVFHPGETVELKNIALLPEDRGKGIGKEIIRSFLEQYKEKGFKKMKVGTANSSISNIAFYQKSGFRLAGIEKNFFLRYGEEIFEDGIQAVDMILFEKYL